LDLAEDGGELPAKQDKSDTTGQKKSNGSRKNNINFLQLFHIDYLLFISTRFYTSFVKSSAH